MSSFSKLVPHRQGTTRAAYSKDGQFIFTTGADCVVRRFKLGSNEEPLALDPLHEDAVTGIVVSNEKIVTCSEDASVALFDIKGGESQKICRTTLPIREIAFSPDGQWVAIASEYVPHSDPPWSLAYRCSETKVKIVNVFDMLKVMELKAVLAKSIKHVSFHPSGSMISTVDTNGAVRIYSLSTEEPSIIETLSGIVPIIPDSESPISCKVAWHPDGASFAVPTSIRDIVVYDRIEWKKQVMFTSGHSGAITDMSWSPNGAYLASSGQDNKIVIWETKSQKLVKTIDVPLYAQQVVWHPHKNVISWTTHDGELYTQEDVLSPGHDSPCTRPIRPSPLQETPSTSNRANGHVQPQTTRRAAPDDEETAGITDEDALLDDLEDAGAEWIEDDDGAGYIPNLDHRNKRLNGNTEDDPKSAKRIKSYTSFEPQIHEPVQPGATPWRGQRRYLTLNMIGWIWTVEQDDHNTVTVEFHDREAHRQYHFTDMSIFSYAVLDEVGALFASAVRTDAGVRLPATVHYRPHESWAAHSNWSVTLPPDEDVMAIALSNSGVVVCTSKGYIRLYSLNGVPRRIQQSKHQPIVSAISCGNLVLVVSNGAVRSDGATELVYSIFHTHRDETIQSNDIVALPPATTMKSLFFGEDGNPYIYSSHGVLSVLSKWKISGQAQWIPMLDTNLLQRRIGKDENYWPVAVSNEKFHCIILKGAERHPYFPRPITSEFDFMIPITVPDHLENSQASLEMRLAQSAVLSSMAEEADDEAEVLRLEKDVDRSILQLLNLACKNEQDARALDLCEMLQKSSSFDAAVRIAGHHNRVNLAERIGRISLDPMMNE